MTLETYKSLKPRDYEQYLEYIFMEVGPESVGSKDDFQDNFDRWLAEQDVETIIRHADAYAGLLVSYNVQTQMKITIIVNGIVREYQGEYHELHARDWNERIRDILDAAYYQDTKE